MLHCCDVLNPSRYFFTAGDFEDTLLTIDGLLKDYERKKIDQKLPGDSNETKALLEQAYGLALNCWSLGGKQKKPDKQLIFLLGDILRQYGHLCLKENFFVSKQVFLASLNMYFYAVDLLDTCFDMQDFPSLEDLKKQARAKPHLFDVMEDHILSTHVEGCIAAAMTDTLAKSYPSRRLGNLADGFRQLGQCYQHLDNYQTLNPINDHRLIQLFNLSEGLYLLMGDEKSQIELADLYFQSKSYLFQRQKPDEVDELCSLCNKVLVFDNSSEMQVRVANKCFMILFKTDRKEEAYLYLQKAVDGLKVLGDQEKSQNVFAQVHHNLCSYYMDPKTIDLDKAETHLKIATLYAAKCRDIGEDRFEFAFYDLRLAELKLVMGEFARAKDAVESAIKTLQKNLDCQQSLMSKAQALRSIIEDAIKFGLKF